GVQIRSSELENGFRNSNSVFGVRKGVSEFKFDFRIWKTNFGVQIRFLESENGFRNSNSVFVVRKRFSELPRRFMSAVNHEHVDRGERRQPELHVDKPSKKQSNHKTHRADDQRAD